MIDYPRHSTGRAYARALEIIGYVVAVLGIISGVVTMIQVSFFAGLGYLLGSLVTGIGLFVLGELVLTFFHIEYNTTIMREHIVSVREHASLPTAPQRESERTIAAHPQAHEAQAHEAQAHEAQVHEAHTRSDLAPGKQSTQ